MLQTQDHVILNAINFPIARVNQRGDITWRNLSFASVFGDGVGEIFHLMEEGKAVCVTRSHILSCLEGMRPIVFRGVYQQGEAYERWYQFNIDPVEDEGDFVVTVVDVTDDNNLNRSLMDSRALLLKIVAHIPHAVFWKDSSLQYTGGNDVFIALALGQRSSASEGGHNTDHFAWELVGLTEHDMPWPDEIKQRLHAQDQEVIRTGQPIVDHRELLYSEALGQRQMLISKIPIIKNEVVDGVVGIFTDITDIQSMEQQLAQARRLEAIGQLAAGIAHEINTPMQYIGDNLQFLKKSTRLLLELAEQVEAWSEDPKTPAELLQVMSRALKASRVSVLRQRADRSINNALEGTASVSKIVRAMKGFSHPGQVEKRESDINNAIESTVTISRNEWKYVAKVEMELEPGLPWVTCDINELSQVLLNLIVNASHSIGDHRKVDDPLGTITLRTISRPDLGVVEIRVEDTGGGIPEEVKARMFDPFFTTKEVGRGTGQGLSLARSIIVDHHKGSIDCESSPGQGAVFIVKLPLVAPA